LHWVSNRNSPQPLAFGLPFSLGFQVLRNTVTALSRPQLALYVMVFTVLWNGVGDYVLIFGYFGMPRLGLVGSGIASASSFVFSFLAMATAGGLRRHSLWRDFFRPQWTELREIFRLGLSMSVMQIFESALYLFAHLAVGTFGAVAMAAHAIAWNVQTLTSVVPFGVGTAATVRVGLAVGGGDAQSVRRAGYAAFASTSAVMAMLGFAMALFAPQIAGLYLGTSAQKIAVIAMAVPFLWVAAAYQVADGLQMTAALALRGLKDVRIPMWMVGASFWLIGFPACIFLAFDASFNALGIWIGMGAAVFVAAAALVTRFVLLTRCK
jgi:multidrug resistance protein, MATE family